MIASRYFALVLVLGIPACGSSDGGGASEAKPLAQDPAGAPPATPAAADTFSMAVTDDAGLPACDAPSKGRLAYVISSQQFKACDGATWAVIEVKGKDGAAGSDGKNGQDGKDGSANKISSSVHCGGELETTGIWFDYSAAQMSSGDVFVSAHIRASAIQASATAFYSADQAGADTAGVTIQYDLVGASNAGYWTLSLDRKTLVTTIDYKDADVTGQEQVFTMTPDKCQVQSH